MRTKDDAPIRIKLMVFYELKEIETMVGDIKESLYESMILYVYITVDSSYFVGIYVNFVLYTYPQIVIPRNLL